MIELYKFQQSDTRQFLVLSGFYTNNHFIDCRYFVIIMIIIIGPSNKIRFRIIKLGLE